MESTPPPIPVLLLPAAEAKVKRPVKFDWQDVTDPSGVTYTLQVAKDRNFNEIVLVKEGLTQSDYTVTEQEELELIGKEKYYWWQVRATDGASNKSDWSTARSFSLGFAFSLPDWAIYLLGALGGLLLFAVGFLLVRRKSKVV
jgi:hypothetical protein